MARNAKIALVTARPRPEVNADHDMPLLVDALRATGVDAHAVAWDAPGTDWSTFDLAVIRSPWDYSWRSQEFLRWVDAADRVTRLANSRDVVRWNANKRYLHELAGKGVPVVPTRFLDPGDAVDLTGMAGDFVVKPAVGAGARYAARYRPDEVELATEHIEKIHRENAPAMIQPYLTAIDTVGERALVFVGNRFVHAIRKKAVLSVGLRYDERRDGHPGAEPWQPTPTALALAERALDAVPQRDELLYARIDMLVEPDGTATLTEMELVEPGLYLRFHPQTLPAVAEAIAAAGNACVQESGNPLPAMASGRNVVSAAIAGQPRHEASRR